MVITLAKTQSPPRKRLIMKDNKIKDRITRTADRFEELE